MQRGQKRSVIPAFFHKISVKAVPAKRQVWVSINKPGGGSAVLAFDYQGGPRLPGGAKRIRGHAPYLEASKSVREMVHVTEDASVQTEKG